MAKQVLNTAFDKGESSECNFRRIDAATGRYVWFYGSCMPLKQADGSVYVFCTFVVISRQKKIEEELAESRRQGNETAMNLSKLYNEEIMRLSTFYDGYTCIIRYNLNKNCVECMKGETLSGLIKVGMSLDECSEKTEYFLRNEKAIDTFFNIFDREKMLSLFNSGKRTLTTQMP